MLYKCIILVNLTKFPQKNRILLAPDIFGYFYKYRHIGRFYNNFSVFFIYDVDVYFTYVIYESDRLFTMF